MTKKKQQDVDYKVIAEQLAQENAAMSESLLRERADATNVRRRADEERSKLGTFYKSLVVRELLPVIDNFERALKNMPKELADNDYMKGVQGIVKQFETTLNKLGVKRIKTIGEIFDPVFHEAISMEEGSGLSEVITEELQAGYILQDEIIRHAMVRVKMQ